MEFEIKLVSALGLLHLAQQKKLRILSISTLQVTITVPLSNYQIECIIVFNRHHGPLNKSQDKSSPAVNVKQREISAPNRTRAAINTSDLEREREKWAYSE